MIGFLTNATALTQIEAGFSAAFSARGVPQYLTLGAFQIEAGEHEGKWFIPFSDDALAQPLHGNHTISEFPEFAELVALLGGLDARIDLPDSEITQPLSP